MRYDVIVCGAGPSGINAAISASRNGANVLLIEATSLLGGNAVNSLVAPWMTFHKQQKRVVGGIASEMVERLVKSNDSLGYVNDPLGFCETVTPVNIEAVKALFFDMIKEENIDLLLNATVFDAKVENHTITSLKIMSKGQVKEFEADVFIDTTGDGELSVKAGAKYIYGRESDNLAQPMTMIFQVGHVDLGKLKQAMIDDPEDFVLSEDYDYSYIGISGFFKKVSKAKKNGDFDLPRDRVLLFEDVIPNSVTINITRIQKLNPLDPMDLTKAEIQGREQIKKGFAFLKKYIPGFENSYISATPVSIGIRETRHIIGEYILNYQDIVSGKKFNDSVALSGFPVDIHSPDGQKLELPEVHLEEPISIPKRSLLVKDLDNLLVAGRCISATHEACASIRVIPTAMALGQAAGTIAAMAINKKQTIREIPTDLLQETLKKQGQIF